MIWTAAQKEQLATLYLHEKLAILEISRQLNRSTASVNNALTRFKIGRARSLPKCIFPKEITPALARIHAHVCGDGHLFRHRERDDYGYLSVYRKGYYRQRFGFGYTNTNKKLIELFVADVAEAFGLNAKYFPPKHRVDVRSKLAWEKLKELGAGKSRDWSIPAGILSAGDEIKTSWIKAFFDDEAHFVPRGGIRVRSVNRNGLEQLKHMLSAYVPSSITPSKGLYPDGSCYLAIIKKYRADFMRLIGSNKFAEASAAYT